MLQTKHSGVYIMKYQEVLIKKNPGETIIQENELSRKLFIIQSGKVRVYKTYLGQKVTLAILGKGEIFGELSFIDAAPRSASVEAFTEVDLLTIDSGTMEESKMSLPPWVLPVIKTLTSRFREADQQLTVLKSLTEFQKKRLKIDHSKKTIYLEMLRFIKTLTVIAEKIVIQSKSITKDKILQDMSDVLGNRYLGLHLFWKTLELHGFVQIKSNQLNLHNNNLKKLTEFLSIEIEMERFLLLSHSALAIMRKIISELNINTTEITNEKKNNSNQSFDLSALQIQKISLYEDSLKELNEFGLLTWNQEKDKKLNQTGNENVLVEFEPNHFVNVFIYQNILKPFDHSEISLD